MIPALLTLAVLASETVAAAPRAIDPPAGAARLSVERLSGAESCPNDQELKAAVARRLGFDPFDPRAAREIRCTIRRADGSLRARIEIVAAGVAATATGRDLTSHGDSCAELAEALELAVGIAINPLVIARSSSATSSTATVPRTNLPPVSAPPSRVAAISSTAAPPPPSSVVRASAARSGPRFELGVDAGAGAALGFGPGVAPTVAVGASLRGRALSLDVGGRIVGPSSADAATGSVTAWLWSASAGPCVHRGVLAGCAVASAGALRARGDGFVSNVASSAPFLAIGPRAVVDIPLGQRLRLRWLAEVAVPLVSIRLTVDGRDVWTSSRVNALSSLGLAVNFR